jgi:hypothetical protein
MPRPTVWSVRTAGYAQIEGDSRSHVEKDDASSEVRNSIMIATSLARV